MEPDPTMHAAQAAAFAAVTEYTRQMLAEPQQLRGQQTRGTGVVAEFETLLAQRCGFPYALATCNATLGLLITALAAELAGKEVIVPPQSWGGTYGPFEFAGATLVKADADAAGNLCPASLPVLLTPNTAAVVVVDWQGQRHDRHALRSFCDQHGLLYIVDGSCIPREGEEDEGRSLADVQILSFGPGKPLHLGEGGAILTRHRWLYEAAVAMSQHPERSAAEGLVPGPLHPFLNARIHPLAACLGAELLAGCEG